MTKEDTIMNKLIILGSGSAAGVPSISRGWGKCDRTNPKNLRMRTGTYIEYEGLKFMIDTSPDLRTQMLDNELKNVDFILYTHIHPDHTAGIFDIREINRLSRKPVSLFSTEKVMKEIRGCYGYLFGEKKKLKKFSLPIATAHSVKINQPFYIKGVKITAIKLLGHYSEECVGYVFDDGELVYISDFKKLSLSALKAIKKKPKILIIPLTSVTDDTNHANLKTVKAYIEKIDANRTILNHMSTDCDYDEVNQLTSYNTFPGFDGLEIEF